MRKQKCQPDLTFLFLPLVAAVFRPVCSC